MKILVLCYEYPPIGGGGGRAARDISRALASRGHQIEVHTAALGFQTSRDEDFGTLVHRHFAFRLRPERCSIPEMAGYLVGAAKGALRSARIWSPDVIHAHFAVPTGALAWFLHRRTGIPYVLTAQLGDVPGGMGSRTAGLFAMLNPFIRPIWSQAAAVTACSSFTAQLGEAAYKRHVEVILNGIDLPEEAPVIPAPREARRLVFAGRFDPQKNLLLLIEALALLPPDAKWHLDLVGDGPQRQELARLITRRGLVKKVTFHGWIAPEEARKVVAQSEVFIMPSHQEGLPLAVLEGLRAHLAIVGSDIGGLRDVLVHDRNGLVFAENDKQSLCEALQRVIQGPTLLSRMREASGQLLPKFDLQNITTAYEDTLRKACQII